MVWIEVTLMIDMEKAKAEIIARHNAQFARQTKNRGPQAALRLNAYKHGLTGQIQLCTPERATRPALHREEHGRTPHPAGRTPRRPSRAVEEAILIAQIAKSKGETYHIPADYPTQQFVFSRAEIEPLITRKQRLDEARALPKDRNER